MRILQWTLFVVFVAVVYYTWSSIHKPKGNSVKKQNFLNGNKEDVVIHVPEFYPYTEKWVHYEMLNRTDTKAVKIKRTKYDEIKDPMETLECICPCCTDRDNLKQIHIQENVDRYYANDDNKLEYTTYVCPKCEMRFVGTVFYVLNDKKKESD